MTFKKYNSQKVIRRDKKCVYCDSQDDLTVDHVIAVSRRKEYRLSPGEVHNYGNLVAACRQCNTQKSGRKLEDFFDEHPEKKKRFIHNAKFLSNRVRSFV